MLSSVFIVIGGLSVGFLFRNWSLPEVADRTTPIFLAGCHLPSHSSEEKVAHNGPLLRRVTDPISKRPVVDNFQERRRDRSIPEHSQNISRELGNRPHIWRKRQINMRGGDVLHSHTPETAAQEVAALLMACSIIAEQRLEAARVGNINPLSISFIKTLEHVNALWIILSVSEGMFSDATIKEMSQRVRDSVIRQATPERRKRNCPRKVRQPICGWPRLTDNESNEGEYEFEIAELP
jgi:hypothetical protein